MNKITEFAWNITAFEGFENGTASVTNRNPGNLRFNAYTESLGATVASPAGFARFPNFQTGFQALVQFLTDAANGKNSSYKLEMTIMEFFAVFAPSSDDNNPNSYAANVCTRMGIPLTTTLSSLLSD